MFWTALAVVIVLLAGLVLLLRHRAVILQWGKFTNTRAGLLGHDYWEDEPDVVEYTDYRWWVRLWPNPGYNLPRLGYFSRAYGFHKRPPVGR